MVTITSVRAPFPVAEVSAVPPTGSRPQGVTDSMPPVATTVLELAVQQVASKPAVAPPQFMAAQVSMEDSAAIAAEAARKAYIKASFAAGISPLPLP